MKDTLTVLFCARGHCATKTHRMANGKVETIGYNAGMFFLSRSWQVNGIHELSQALVALQIVPRALVIRGEAQPALDPDEWHQRTKAGPKVNYLTPPRGRRYVMIDIDKLALPKGLQLAKKTLLRVINYVISQLPPEFQNVSFHWQLSSSAGMGDPGKVSMHLWFWLNAPVSDENLKMWGNAVNKERGIKLIDTALFNDVQVHYTAAPIFEGMSDPFPRRSGLVEKERHDVELVLSTSAQRATHAEKEKHRETGNAETTTATGFNQILACIGDHPGGDGFHEPIIRATASYVASAGGDNVDIEWLYQTVRDQALAADASNHDAGYVERMASREHIIPAIEGAIRKYGGTPVSRRKTKLHQGVAPHFSSKPVSVAEAMHRLANIVKDGF